MLLDDLLQRRAERQLVHAGPACTWPLTPKSVLPVLFSVPSALNHSAPLRMITGTCDIVSTLLTVVGQPHSPETAGNGGRLRGWPFLPSIDSIMPVSSPQMYAPAPRVHVDVERRAGAEDVVAEEAARVGLLRSPRISVRYGVVYSPRR